MVFVHHRELLGFAIANCSEPLDGKEMPCKVEWIYFQLKIVHNAIKTKKMNGAYRTCIQPLYELQYTIQILNQTILKTIDTIKTQSPVKDVFSSCKHLFSVYQSDFKCMMNVEEITEIIIYKR